MRPTVKMHPLFAVSHFIARAERAATTRDYRNAEHWLARADDAADEAEEEGHVDRAGWHGLDRTIDAARKRIEAKVGRERLERKQAVRALRLGA
jgi:hypothetical protein